MISTSSHHWEARQVAVDARSRLGDWRLQEVNITPEMAMKHTQCEKGFPKRIFRWLHKRCLCICITQTMHHRWQMSQLFYTYRPWEVHHDIHVKGLFSCYQLTCTVVRYSLESVEHRRRYWCWGAEAGEGVWSEGKGARSKGRGYRGPRHWLCRSEAQNRICFCGYPKHLDPNWGGRWRRKSESERERERERVRERERTYEQGWIH